MKNKQERIQSAFHVENRNYQVLQQSFLICLLNQYCEIHLTKQKKRSHVTLPFFTIEKIIFNDDDVVNFNEIIEKRCTEIKSFDISKGVSLKTASRRYKSNRITEVLHLLMDFIRQHENPFITRTTFGKNGAKQMEIIEKCIVNGNELNKFDIMEIGIEKNCFFDHVITNQNVCILKQGFIKL